MVVSEHAFSRDFFAFSEVRLKFKWHARWEFDGETGKLRPIVHWATTPYPSVIINKQVPAPSEDYGFY